MHLTKWVLLRIPPPPSQKKIIKNQLKWPFWQSFRGMRRHDLRDVRMYQFFLSVRNVFKQEGSFFYIKFSHSNTAKKCEENIKTKTKRREKKWICTKTTYQVTTGLVFQYITNINPTPEKPCATQISNVILMYQSNIGLVTRKPFSEVWKSESSAYNQMRCMSPQL